MSVTNGESVVTKEILNEYHQAILPYLGGGGGGGATYTAGDGINIDENNEISTDNMPSSDMSEVASPMPSVMSRRFKYSTEEQVVGEWIDGKPIYQKTFTDLSITMAWNSQYQTYATIDALDSNIDKFIDFKGYDDDSGLLHINAYWYNSTQWRLTCCVDGIVKTAIIQYTKTID